MLIVTPLAVRTGFAFSFGNKTYSNIHKQQFLSKYMSWMDQAIE